MSENICIQALITSSVGNICCENVLPPTGVTLYLHFCVRWICPRLSFFAFKKFFVASRFIALWFICILLWVLLFCCYSCDKNLFYCEKSHCEHPSFRANLRERVVKINIAKSTKDLGVERSNTVHTFVNFYLVSTTLTAFAFVFFSVIICFNKHVPHWYLHRQMTFHSDCRHTNTMHCILYVYNLNAAEVKAMLTHLCISFRYWLCPRDRKIESRYWLYWHVFPSLSP